MELGPVCEEVRSRVEWAPCPPRPRVSLSDWHRQNKDHGMPHFHLHLAYIDDGHRIALGQSTAGPCEHGTLVEPLILGAGFKNLDRLVRGRKTSNASRLGCVTHACAGSRADARMTHP